MLRNHKWSVEAATNDWFTSGMKPAGAAGKGTVSGPKVAAMFAKYAGQPTVSAAAWRPVAGAWPVARGARPEPDVRCDRKRRHEPFLRAPVLLQMRRRAQSTLTASRSCVKTSAWIFTGLRKC